MGHITLLALMLLQAPVAQTDGPQNGDMAMEQGQNLSDTDRLAKAKEDLASMRGILSKVIKHLSAAREEKDTVKLNCVNEKLTKIKGLLRISEQADVAMQEAIARKDNSSIAGEFAKISISKQKCSQLAADSEACIGELAVYAGDDELELYVENESPYSQDQLTADLADTPVAERPTEASPYQ